MKEREVKPFIQDFVVQEGRCNMKCTYCLTSTSTFKPSKEGIRNLRYESGNELGNNMDLVTSRLSQAVRPVILKVSGGEILLIKGITDYLKKMSRVFKAVQLLTNGVLLSEKLVEELCGIPNLCLQVSLDHHTLAGNSYRVKTKRQQDLILQNLTYAVTRGIPVEVNCVFSNRNAEIFTDFCQYFIDRKLNVAIFPFPPRGETQERFLPGHNQLWNIKKLLEQFDHYKSVLPPQAYLHSLVEFLERRGRTVPCVLPLVAVGSFDDGILTPCANFWFTSLGNVLEENYRQVLSKIGTNTIYQIFRARKHSLRECSRCFTPWDMLNLYCQDILSLEELCQTPLYSFPGVQDALSRFKAEWKGGVNV